jgi:hypothetical protein
MKPLDLRTASPKIVPGQEVHGRCVALMVEDKAYPQTRRVDMLTLELTGLSGTRHYGFTRKAGAREPWYKRGMEMRSGRQLTVVSQEDLAAIATIMGLPKIEPEWIGANIVVTGVPHVSFLPSGTRIHFADATVVVEAQNAPCRIAGKAIAQHVAPGGAPGGIELDFAQKAKGLRGVVASVERAGPVRTGEDIVVKVPPQWLWQV